MDIFKRKEEMGSTVCAAYLYRVRVVKIYKVTTRFSSCWLDRANNVAYHYILVI